MSIKGKIIIWTSLVAVIYIQFIRSNWCLLILPLMIKWHFLFNRPTGLFIRNYNINLKISSGNCTVSITNNTMLNYPCKFFSEVWSLAQRQRAERDSQNRMKRFADDSECSFSFKSLTDVGSHMIGEQGQNLIHYTNFTSRNNECLLSQNLLKSRDTKRTKMSFLPERG